jgi:hypothetical protein
MEYDLSPDLSAALLAKLFIGRNLSIRISADESGGSRSGSAEPIHIATPPVATAHYVSADLKTIQGDRLLSGESAVHDRAGRGETA